MTIHKVDPNNLPDCEVLAFNGREMLVGELYTVRKVVYCETHESQINNITHYIHASDLLNLFKSAQDGNPKD